MFHGNQGQSKKQSGFSLMELLIAMTITLSLLALVAGILSAVRKEYFKQQSRMEALHNANIAIDAIVRLVRMAGTKPPQCTSLNFQALTPSQSDGSGGYQQLQVQGDWNPADCALTGTEENVTFSISNGVLYEDAARTSVFVDGIGSLKFKFYDSSNTLIADPVTNNSQISLVQIEIETYDVDGYSTTVKSSAQLRKE